MMGYDQGSYYGQTLSQTWTNDAYKEVYPRAKWSWQFLPFGAPRNRYEDWYKGPSGRVSGPIIEIGSACANAYAHLLDTKLIDLSQYSGYEISDYGISYSRERYPQVNWIQADFTRVDINQRFDYGFERHAIHHMPDPLAQYEKVLSKIDVAFATTFVSCLNGDTISDLNIARYQHQNGDIVYFDIINPFQLIHLGHRLGFNHFAFYLQAEHEPVKSDSLGDQYLSPDVDVEKRFLCRTAMVLSKTGGPLQISLVTPYDKPGKRRFGGVLSALNPVRRRFMEAEAETKIRIQKFLENAKQFETAAH